MSDWIPVADSDPPINERLLVAYDPALLIPAVMIGTFSGSAWTSEGRRMPAPLLWMPIPAIPEQWLTEAPVDVS